MDAFITPTGTAAPLRRTNVDTDQVIPAEYLKRITRTGFEDGLFVAWRTNQPDFVLNQPQYRGAAAHSARLVRDPAAVRGRVGPGRRPGLRPRLLARARRLGAARRRLPRR